MVAIYESAKTETSYNATRFLQMVAESGGLECARQLLRSPGASDGFSALWQRGRLDLTVEAHVLQPRFEELFSEEERDIARGRLLAYGFGPDG